LPRTQPQPLAYSDQITVSVQRTTSFVASPKALSSALIGWVAAAETGEDAVNLFEARTSPLRQDTELGVLALYADFEGADFDDHLIVDRQHLARLADAGKAAGAPEVFGDPCLHKTGVGGSIGVVIMHADYSCALPMKASARR